MRNYPLIWQEFLFFFGVGSLVHTMASKLDAHMSVQVILPLAVLILGCVARAQYNVANAKEFRFKPVAFEKGTGALDCILKAKDSIIVTHFVGDCPNKSYVAAMLAKMEDGVFITRILPANIDRSDETSNWLNDFAGKSCYKERETTSYKLPFDVWIVDNCTVIICFPITADAKMVRHGYSFENTELAGRLKTSLNRVSEPARDGNTG